MAVLFSFVIIILVALWDRLKLSRPEALHPTAEEERMLRRMGIQL